MRGVSFRQSNRFSSCTAPRINGFFATAMPKWQLARMAIDRTTEGFDIIMFSLKRLRMIYKIVAIQELELWLSFFDASIPQIFD
jgi:hypothetical protein